MKIDRVRLAPFTYLLGLLSLLFAAGWFVVNRQFGSVVQIALGVTLLAWAGGVLLDPDRVRQALSGRRARYGSNALLLGVAFAGILAVVNYFAAQNPQSWDLTEDRQFSLAPETRQLLATLEQPVTIKGFYTANQSQARENVEPLLERYQQESNGLVSHEFIDPRSSPLEAEQYGVTRDGSLVVIQGQTSETVSFANEREITSAILRVTSPGERKVYFLTGHGERDIQDSGETGYADARRALTSKGYTVAGLNLLSEQQIPRDARVVVIAGPQAPLEPSEVEALQSYLERGGSLIVLYDPSPETQVLSGSDPLKGYLEETWGVNLQDNLVVDLTSNFPLSGIAASYAEHPITDRMGNLVSVFPTVRGVSASGTVPEDAELTELVLTGQDSWGETDFDAITQEGNVQFNEGQDQGGPVTLVVAAERFQPPGRLVVFGDADFAVNGNFNQYGNGDLLVNSVDWGAREEQLINLTPGQQSERIIAPPSVQMVGLIFLVTIILIPGGVVGMGVSVWWRRRRSR